MPDCRLGSGLFWIYGVLSIYTWSFHCLLNIFHAHLHIYILYGLLLAPFSQKICSHFHDKNNAFAVSNAWIAPQLLQRDFILGRLIVCSVFPKILKPRCGNTGCGLLRPLLQSCFSLEYPLHRACIFYKNNRNRHFFLKPR